MNNAEVKNNFSNIATSAATTAALYVAVLAEVPQVASPTPVTGSLAQLQTSLNAQLASLRTKQTNAGDLVADALLSVAQSRNKKIVALINGGAIRGGVFYPRTFTSDEVTTLLPFSDIVVQFPAISASLFKGVLENSVSDRELVADPLVPVPVLDGRFGQIAGFSFTYNPAHPEGKRVISATLDDGTKMIANGSVVSGAPDISLVTTGFVASGGDGYPLAGKPFENLNITLQAVVTKYIVQRLGGEITAQAYPESGKGRIRALACITNPNPSLGVLPLGAVGAISDANNKLASVA
jgi:5'-nucleotidase